MSMLLLIRNANDMPRAIEDTRAFSDFLQERFASDQENTRILGVWLRRELDAGLPCSRYDDSGFEGGVPVNDADRSWEPDSAASSLALHVKQSFSLSGIWAICWLGGSLLDDARSSAERRLAIVQTLVSPHSQGNHVFFPVFQQGDSAEHIQTAMHELRDQYPELIGATWLMDDREQGLIAAEPDQPV